MDCQGPVLDRGTHPASGTWRYRAFGLTIASQVPLPQLAACATGGTADLVVALGQVEPGFESRPGYRRGRIYDQFRYEAVDGVRIVVEPLPGSSPSNIADGLMSRVLTAALYQRGLLPLHASAVVLSEGAIAVAGPSGAGKSTLAAMLARQGGRVLADDMLVLADDVDPRCAWGGAGGLKLTTGSLGTIGRGSEGLALANTAEGKYFLPMAAEASAQPVPITTLICLREGPPALETVPPFRALAEWKHRVKMPELIENAPCAQTLFRRWLDFVGAARVVMVSHGRDMAALAAIAQRLPGECGRHGEHPEGGGEDDGPILQRHGSPAQA
ncbi:hypothetical protein E2493_00655 [Sphingomonas parva]|uniref:Serine kinase n=1 Tax=Sphingomonas parva TaxID=2555898 RepID=A0A4Y8ZXI5_9SPHN|nr:hypothetical protein [Sphingomonas parva]TFI60257.1 hypothetical protein E2493_00655 [Sphingomonas parva]